LPVPKNPETKPGKKFSILSPTVFLKNVTPYFDEGASKGADEDVRKAKERGLKVYYKLEDVPDAGQQ
jgi:hypothetical protein